MRGVLSSLSRLERLLIVTGQEVQANPNIDQSPNPKMQT